MLGEPRTPLRRALEGGPDDGHDLYSGRAEARAARCSPASTPRTSKDDLVSYLRKRRIIITSVREKGSGH